MMRYAILIAMLLCLPVCGEAWQVVGGAAATSGAPFLSDTFTDVAATLIPAHTPEIGGAWTTNNSFVKILTGGAVGLDPNSLSLSFAINSASPPSADYSVTGEGILNSINTDRNLGVCGRMASTNSGYCAYVIAGTAGTPLTLRIAKVVSGTKTDLDTVSLTRNHFSSLLYKLRITMDGSSITASELIDNVSVTVADSTYTASGSAGMHFRGNGPSFYWIDAQ